MVDTVDARLAFLLPLLFAISYLAAGLLLAVLPYLLIVLGVALAALSVAVWLT